tara:strand:- start:587 stop:3043 length:2457 start_codon:yes stop_codon:yes gene_type:complete
MLEDSILKSNFIGRDGFRWWIGQVASEEAQGDQLNQIGSTWGCRIKVRIMGYHPQNTVELKDEDLPWAQILLSPQGGSGKANRARSIRVAPGDTVLGFFLDGDDAQLPVVLGIFGNTNYSPSDEYSGPFKPFTGYTSKIKPNNEFIAKNEGGDDSSSSQKSPRFLTKELVEDLNEATEAGRAQLKQLVDSDQLRQAATEVSEELKQVMEGGAAQTGIKNDPNNAAESARQITEGLKKTFQYPTTQAFKALGQEIIYAQGGKASADNSKATNQIKNTLKNTLSEMKSLTFKDKFKGIFEGADQIVSASKGMIKDMVNTTFDSLSPELNSGLHKLYKDEYGKVLLESGGNILLAKKAATAAQKAMIGPVLNIQDAMPCVMKKVTDKLKLDVANLLTDFLNNVENFTECIGDQFIGALFNDIIKGINGELAGAIEGVASIFPSGDIEGMLRSKAEGLLGIASIFSDCDVPSADLGEKTNGWLLGIGPIGVNLENIAGEILNIANAAQSLREAAASPGGIIGNLGIFDFMLPDVSTPGFNSTLSSCYTGPPLNCSGIKVNLFGGGGQGAQVNPILGALVTDTFAKQTASLIGMRVINPGSGYKSPPFVEITDTCRKGYGAVARSVIDYDPSSPTYQQVTDVYIVSAGENYPVIEPDEDDNSGGQYTVDHVVVVKPGQNYKPEDVVIDNKGNVYEKFLDEQGRILNVIPPDPTMNNLETFTTVPEIEIVSSTGIGALLKGQLAPRPSYQGEIKQVIDCITPKGADIVGFVNGEPYYGPFHVNPITGVRMVGVAHTTTSHAIIYDTPQESRTSRGSTDTNKYNN